jgi:small subunit ribosomal protein S16
MGSRNAPFYRVIAQDSRYATTGRFIETLGWYDPKQDGNNFSLNLDRIDYWLGNGAQPSDTANSLIQKARVLPSEKAVSGAVAEEEIPAVAEEAAAEEAEAPAEEAAAAEEVAEEKPAADEGASEEPVAEEQAAEEPETAEEEPADKKA